MLRRLIIVMMMLSHDAWAKCGHPRQNGYRVERTATYINASDMCMCCYCVGWGIGVCRAMTAGLLKPQALRDT